MQEMESVRKTFIEEQEKQMQAEQSIEESPIKAFQSN